MSINNKENTAFHDVSLEHLYEQLKTSESGLEQKDAAERLVTYGNNSLPRNKQMMASYLLLKQFLNPLFYILLFAMVLSFIMGHISDGVIIAIVVLISGLIGFIQEYKANKALSKLNSIITYKARVLRDGALSIINQEDVVPGDIIDFGQGDIVPADARLIATHNLSVLEALLTGEPEPSIKFVGTVTTKTPLADRENIIFQGTAVNEGTGRALVITTGANTEMGKIASALKDTQNIKTPLQKQISGFAKWLSIFLIFANILIFTAGLLLGRSMYEMFMISVVLVVSAIPEGLVPAMSIVLALGMQRLIKKKGLVRKIISAETLGSVSVICTDKTGTLTEGEMNLDKIITESQTFKINKNSISQNLSHSCLLALRICTISNNAINKSGEQGNDTKNIIGNNTDKAMLIAGSYYGLTRETLELENKRLDELPFSSENKIMATLHKSTSLKNVIYIKGAPEKILPLASTYLSNENEVKIDDAYVAKIYKQINQITKNGQRVVAVAYRETKSKKISDNDLNNLVFVGLVVIKDKVRKDAKLAIEACHIAGIKVMVITGDHANTAIAIAGEVGIKAGLSQVINGNEIDELSDEELGEKIKNVLIFARVEPRHKLKIVTLLRANGEVVAMTGDGINDAPALKSADIGIAMGNGTDVAKEVSDLVLLDSNFMTIVEAVRQGRITYANIRKVVVYLFTDCFQEMIIIGTSVLAGWPLPILPAQILWSKLIESPLPATSLAFEASNNDVLLDKPRNRYAKLLTNRLKFNITFYALVMDVMALSIFYFYWQFSGDINKTRTIIFVALGTSSLFNVYNIRSLGRSVFHTNPLSNLYLVFASIVGILLFLVAVYSKFMNNILQTTPLNINDWLIILTYAGSSLIVFETGKMITKYKI